MIVISITIFVWTCDINQIECKRCGEVIAVICAFDYDEIKLHGVLASKP